ncbi:MAG: hypothetical protein JJU29_23410 [Verrucomicrobia bacterium]|nr:hypothetical protein [Verrucomicrobiota bacterium]MCH8513430.1 hypothetical protein [Kiritimatiellia bacterium]
MMKQLAALLFLLTLAPLLNAQVGSELYDVYLYHVKIQRDYWTGGSKDHGRTKPYVHLGTVRHEDVAAGMRITVRGNDPRVRLPNSSSACESFQGGAWRYHGDHEIGRVFHNEINEANQEVTVWNECKQKLVGVLGDDTFASIGVMLVPREGGVRNIQLIEQLKAKAEARSDISGLGSALWLEQHDVLNDFESCGESDTCGIIVLPITTNFDDADVPVYEVDGNGEIVLDENDDPKPLNREVGQHSLVVNRRFNNTMRAGCTSGCPPSDEYFRHGDLTTFDGRLHLAWNLGERAGIRLRADAPTPDLGSPMALEVPKDGSAAVVTNEHGEVTQIFTGNNYTEINVLQRVNGQAVKYTISTMEVADQEIPFGEDDFSFVANGNSFSAITTVERLATDGSEVGIEWTRGGSTMNLTPIATAWSPRGTSKFPDTR